MLRASLHVGWGASLLLTGCFSSPPSISEGESGSSTTSASTSSPTSASGTSGITLTSDATTDVTSGPDTGSSSSFSSSGASSGGVETSADGATGESTGVPGCQGGRVEVGRECLTPLSIAGSHTVAGEDGGTFDALMPCLAASCGADLPLGGGFDNTNIALRSNEADFDLGSWGICGAALEGETPNLWVALARCAVAEGDVFTVTELFSLANDELGCFRVECPEDTTLVGGGGVWSSQFGVTGSQPTVDGRWEVCGGASASGQQVEVHAYCAVLAQGASITMSEDTQPVAPISVGCAQAVCSTGTAISGGGDGGPLTAEFSVSAPSEVDEAWTACGRTGPLGGQIRSRVLCYQP
jgi:hypothetical protein